MDDQGVAIEFDVTEADTAIALLSGELPVLATPRLIAWLEAATCEAARGRLQAGQTSVGTRVAVDHVAPSAVGECVRVTARITGVDGRTLTFEVRAAAAQSGQVLASGVITRAAVDADRFLARLGRGS